MGAVQYRDNGSKFAVLLHSAELKEQQTLYPTTPDGTPLSAEWVLGARSFYKLLISMLEVTSGQNIAFHLPSHGIGQRSRDLDQVEDLIDNLFRIIDELKESTESNNSLVAQLIKRKMSERGLPSKT